MRIPVAESDVGYWYPIGDNYYFVTEHSPSAKGMEGKYRKSTFARFKEFFPFQYGDVRYRRRERIK